MRRKPKRRGPAPKGYVPITARVPKALAKAIRGEAKATSETISEVIIRAVKTLGIGETKIGGDPIPSPASATPMVATRRR